MSHPIRVPAINESKELTITTKDSPSTHLVVPGFDANKEVQPIALRIKIAGSATKTLRADLSSRAVASSPCIGLVECAGAQSNIMIGKSVANAPIKTPTICDFRMRDQPPQFKM